METKDLMPQNWFRKKDKWGDLRSHKDEYFTSDLYKDIEKIFKNFTREWDHSSYLHPKNYSEKSFISPKIDLSETENAIVIEAELPGVKEEDLDITVSKDNILHIKGKRETFINNENRNYYITERSYGSFERQIALPDYCDNNNIDANFKDGILYIKISRKAPIEGDLKKLC
ncbi:MAG: Hsp20/alpha crystallin family protein [Alphaproteobacteria bacterium]